MPKTSKNTNHKLRRNFAFRIRMIGVLIALAATGLLGSYLTFFTNAVSSSQPQVQFDWGIDAVANIPIGADISPAVSLLRGVPADKMTIITSTYYSSKYLKLKNISCEPNIRCVSVSWPNFDNDPPSGTYMPTTTSSGSTPTTIGSFAYDHKFSTCVNKPNPLPTIPEGGLLLYTPHFTVVGNSKRFVIQTLVRYYRGGSCDSNQGRTSDWYKTSKETGWYQCYNQSGTDGPYYDGISRNSCIDQGYSVPAGNDNVKLTGGLSGPRTTSRGAGSKGAGTNAGGGGGSSSATTVTNTPNSVTKNGSQGTTKQPTLNPSPFYDGRQYAAGSDPIDKAFGNIAIAGRKIARGWIYVLCVLVAAVGGTGVYYWRKRKS